MSTQDTQNLILNYIKEQTGAKSGEEIARALKLKQNVAEEGLRALCERHEILLNRKKKYASPEAMGLIVGRVQVHAKGFAFFIADRGGEDLFVSPDDLNGALNGDRVLLRSLNKTQDGKKEAGEVAEIIHRAQTEVVGEFIKRRGGGLVRPIDERMGSMEVPAGQIGRARNGDMVLSEITQYALGDSGLKGRVLEVLGQSGDAGIAYVALVRQYGFCEAFPRAAVKQAEKIEQRISKAEIKDREDWRKVPVITIDGADSKDLDDAISIRELKNGHYELGVHIADVSHYVPTDTPLDEQAYSRATSVYFADRVFPMLPVALSNGICSLNPGVDRLALSCVMEVDGKGEVISFRVAESVIRSHHRMTYHDVSRILEGDAALCAQYRDIIPELMRMRTLTQALIDMRKRRGALDFDMPEAKAQLGPDGRAQRIVPVERGFSERMIESFMLLANETVAEYMEHLGVTGMYRVHEPPKMESVQTLKQTANVLGYALKQSKGRSLNHALQRLLQDAEGSVEQPMLNMMCLRAMQKARYESENLQHFGLAAPYYTHFTSPIRRYPDLVVHRVLKKVLCGDIIPQTERSQAEMSKVAAHCSERERASEEAERTVMDLQCCEAMHDKIGKQYDGVVSGVTSFGLFVTLPNTVEGLVHVMNLPGYYEYDEKRLSLISRSGHAYRFGSPIRVRVAAVDEQQRRIDFALCKE